MHERVKWMVKPSVTRIESPVQVKLTIVYKNGHTHNNNSAAQLLLCACDRFVYIGIRVKGVKQHNHGDSTVIAIFEIHQNMAWAAITFVTLFLVK